MSELAFLTACDSRGRALHYESAGPFAANQFELVAAWRIPLLWLAGFHPADVFQFQPQDAGDPAAPIEAIVLACTAGREFADRLTRRRAGLLTLLPPDFADFFDEWTRFVRRRFPQQVLLRPERVLAMDPQDAGSARLLAALRWLEPLDRNEPPKEVAALDWLASFSDLATARLHGESAAGAAARWREHLTGTACSPEGAQLWPTRPTPAELAAAGRIAERPAHEDPLTLAVRQGVHPDTAGARLGLAWNKLTGTAPLGVDAPTRGLRKGIGGAGALLELLRAAVGALCLVPIGLGMAWLGLRPLQWTLLGIGAALLLLGVWAGRSAWHAWRRVRAIARA